MNPTGKDVVAVFGASQARPGEPDYEAGIRCGRLLAAAGFAVATGGYAGIMEAVCRGAADVGGPTIGITAPTVFPGRSGANAYVTHEIAAPNLVDRIGKLMDISVASIALPGSLGTLAEMVIAWNLAFVSRFSSTDFGPVVAVGDGWKAIVGDLARRLDTAGELVICVPTVEAAVARVVEHLPPPKQPSNAP